MRHTNFQPAQNLPLDLIDLQIPEQYLHPALYQLFNLPPNYESNFYLPNITLSIPSTPTSSKSVVKRVSLLNDSISRKVFLRIFEHNERTSVCGDGIFDPEAREQCEFSLRQDYPPVLIPPPEYHLEWARVVSEIKSKRRDCIWGPGRIRGCLRDGHQTVNFPNSIFAHYCGDGILDVDSSNVALVEEINRSSSFRRFYTICGYRDKHGLLPIYCNQGESPWIIPGKTIRITPGSTENCDLGELVNGGESSGCTKLCKLRCNFAHGGRVNWTEQPKLPCIQPCLDLKWKGEYCNDPKCEHGIPNWNDGGCYSCDPGWKGINCDENDCVHGYSVKNSNNTNTGCICHTGWYGQQCNESYCLEWLNQEDTRNPLNLRQCLRCVPGKRDPSTLCTKDACVFGEKDWKDPEGRCLQPCSVPFFEGKFCDITNCIQVERISIDEIRCLACLPGYELPYCHKTKGSSYTRCKDPMSFGIDCKQRRTVGETQDCIPGWTGPQCSLLACQLGFPNFTDPMLRCIKDSCLPSWQGDWCHESILNPIQIADGTIAGKNNNSWLKARASLYAHWSYLMDEATSNYELRRWKAFAMKIIYGDTQTALQYKNGNHVKDWTQISTSTFAHRIYLAPSGRWRPLEPPPNTLNAIPTIQVELYHYLQILSEENLFLGVKFPWGQLLSNNNTMPGEISGIPLHKTCLFGRPGKNGRCEECAAGYSGEYCTETNCAEMAMDHTCCTQCKEGFTGDFCQYSRMTTTKASITTYASGGDGKECEVPHCLYGYRLVQQGKDELILIEREWQKRYDPCSISNITIKSRQGPHSLDLKAHQPIRMEGDLRCSACYPGFEGEYCTRLTLFGEEIPCEKICERGLWDWEKGICFPCFAGSYGNRCHKSPCRIWNTTDHSCISCASIEEAEDEDNQEVEGDQRKISIPQQGQNDGLIPEISPLFGMRFGNLCQYKAVCLYGVQSPTDNGCIKCNSPCIEGPYCNETKCATFEIAGPIVICKECKPGWQGPCCRTLINVKDPKMAELESIFQQCNSIGQMDYPYCNRSRCAGIVDIEDKQRRCIPGSCLPGWAGPWCTFALWAGEERSVELQSHLLSQLRPVLVSGDFQYKKAYVDPQKHETISSESAEVNNGLDLKSGLWHGEIWASFNGSQLFTIGNSVSKACKWASLGGDACTLILCKYGISSSDENGTCSQCYPGWLGPYCNITHRVDPIDQNSMECQEGWWNPPNCDKKSLCLMHTQEEGYSCPTPGGLGDQFSDRCKTCYCPAFYKGEYCNKSTCENGIPLHSSPGGCIPGTCSWGWKGPFCNESLCLHGYRLLPDNLIEHNIYSYYSEQRWVYGWKGIGRATLPVGVSIDYKVTKKNRAAPECTKCYPGYPPLPFCDKVWEKDEAPCIHGWFDPANERCISCFPGWTGNRCDETACLQWIEPYVKCQMCKEGLYGPLCQYQAKCLHGTLDQRSTDGRCRGTECTFKFYFGPFCNQTNCVLDEKGNPLLNQLGQCEKCEEYSGYTGPYCVTPLQCQNGLMSALLTDFYSKERKMNMVMTCIPGSCSPGWKGLWCDERTLFKPLELEVSLNNHPSTSLSSDFSPMWDQFEKSRNCAENWTGPLCDVPRCKHGIPNYEEGACLRCYTGWVGKFCHVKPCLFGIPSPKHNIINEVELYSPPCIPGTCIQSWKGAACDEPACFGTGKSVWIWRKKINKLFQILFESNRNYASGTEVDLIPAATDGSIPEINWNTLQCTSCSHPTFGLPECNRINRCVWGVLDETSSEGRCVPRSCQRGGGPFCSLPICYHGVADPVNLLSCHKCYPGWKGYSSDYQIWDHLSGTIITTPEMGSVLDLAPGAPPILICDRPTCVNGWLKFPHVPAIDPHTYICVCFDGWKGENCDQEIPHGEKLDYKAWCPEYTCPPKLNASIDCPPVAPNNSSSIVIMEVAPRNGCPPGLVDSLLVEIFLNHTNS